MSINPKPGNQPDPNDMAGAFTNGSDPDAVPVPGLKTPEQEEEAARLGDFA